MDEGAKIVLGFILFMMIAFGGMFAGLAYETHLRSECVKAYATSTRTADDIAKICKAR